MSRIGLGLAALGRPGYQNVGHGADIGPDASVDALRRRTHEVLDAAWKNGVRYVDAARSYVGRTTRARAGIFQRLAAHLAGRSSFVIKFLKNQRSYSRKGYSFSFVDIANPRLRALVEAYATGVLCPRHIATGEAAA